MKRFGLMLAVAIPILIGILLGLAVWIPQQFLRNEAFRMEMNRQTQTALKLNGAWMPFHLKGWTLTSAGYEGAGTVAGQHVHVRAEQVSFKISWRALLQRKWHIDPVQVGRLEVKISPPKPSPPVQTPDEIRHDTATKAAALFIPTTVDIREIILEDANVSYIHSDQQEFHLNSITSSTIPNGQGSWNTSIRSGTFIAPDRLSWSLNNAGLTGDLNNMTLEHSQWLGAEAGVLKISGPLMRSGRLDASLKIEGRGIPAHSLTPAKWRNFIEGGVDIDATSRVTDGEVSIEGTVQGKGVQLIGVPALRSLSVATGIRKWTELPLDTAWMQFAYRGEELTVSSSVFESKNLIRLEGNFSIRNQELDGVYQVGLAPHALSKIPGAGITVFTLQQSGYHWAQPPMTLSGTSKNPKEDLSPRLKSAIFDAVEEKINQGVNRGLDLLDSLLQRIP